MDEQVRVVARFRPFNSKERAAGELKTSEDAIELSDKRVRVAKGPSFNLDHVFGMSTLQDEVYTFFRKQNITRQVLSGFNTTIFAYGQTGAGKSWSMMGAIESNGGVDKRGIIPRIASDIFEEIDRRSQESSLIEFTMSVSYLEVYLEQVHDLLKSGNHNLVIKESPQKGVHVAGLTEEYVGALEDVHDLLAIGDHLRNVASTNMNAKSSRSHSVFVLRVNQKDGDGNTTEAQVSLVDLAGSEKIKKTGAKGQTLEEAKKINLSLTCLSQCINALTDPKLSHVPFRASKLTRLLQESLGGNSKTTVLVACSPHVSNLQETISTLRFAERCKKVTNAVKENIQLSAAALTKKFTALSHELMDLKMQASRFEASLKDMGVDPETLHEPAEDSKRKVSFEGDAYAPANSADENRTVTKHMASIGLQTSVASTSVEMWLKDGGDNAGGSYELMPSAHVLEKIERSSIPPVGKTFITSTVRLSQYNPETFSVDERNKFMSGVAAACGAGVELHHIRILGVRAGSAIVTYRVEVDQNTSKAISSRLTTRALVSKLESKGLNAKGLTVEEKPKMTEHVSEPSLDVSFLEAGKAPLAHRRTESMFSGATAHETVAEGITSRTSFSALTTDITYQDLVPGILEAGDEKEWLEGELAATKTKNLELKGALEEYEGTIEKLDREQDKLQASIEDLGQELTMELRRLERMITDESVGNRGGNELDLEYMVTVIDGSGAPARRGSRGDGAPPGGVRRRSKSPGGGRAMAVPSERGDRSSRTSLASSRSSRIGSSPISSRRGLDVAGKRQSRRRGNIRTRNAQSVDHGARTRGEVSSMTPGREDDGTPRKVPQLFKPVDSDRLRGEYKTYVSQDYHEPEFERRRGDDVDEEEVASKIFVLQETVDRQNHIMERQASILAQQESRRKQVVEVNEGLRVQCAQLLSKLSEEEVKLLEAVRDDRTSMGVNSRGMGYANRRNLRKSQGNIRLPVPRRTSMLNDAGRGLHLPSERFNERAEKFKTHRDMRSAPPTSVRDYVNNFLTSRTASGSGDSDEDSDDVGHSGKGIAYNELQPSMGSNPLRRVGNRVPRM